MYRSSLFGFFRLMLASASIISPLQPAAATGAVVELLAAQGAGQPGPDRWLAPEIDAAHRLTADGSVLAAVERVSGPLA